MTTKTVKLSEKQIAEQKSYVAKYLNLINKELGYGDLCNLENLASYNKSFKYHSQLANSGVVEIPVG